MEVTDRIDAERSGNSDSSHHRGGKGGVTVHNIGEATTPMVFDDADCTSEEGLIDKSDGGGGRSGREEGRQVVGVGAKHQEEKRVVRLADRVH
eukprot:scaffold4261_cov177-Alexandrium_tamarense.AAC.6